MKNRCSDKQIKFTGTPFVILGTKLLDYTHGKDHAISRKKKTIEEKLKIKVIFTKFVYTGHAVFPRVQIGLSFVIKNGFLIEKRYMELLIINVTFIFRMIQTAIKNFKKVDFFRKIRRRWIVRRR